MSVFFRHWRYRFWKLSEFDELGRSVVARALLDGNGAGIPLFRSNLLTFLKSRGNPRVGPLRIRDFIMLHLLGSIYGEGLYREADTWTTYPGSRGASPAALNPVLKRAATMFRERYVEDLLIRHRHSVDSGATRFGGGTFDFLNQANTIHLNRDHLDRVQDKSVLVIDDFETRGFSMECARNILLEAGAYKVICVSVGKYGYNRYIISPDAEHVWAPSSPTSHTAAAFSESRVRGEFLDEALDTIRESYNRVAATTL